MNVSTIDDAQDEIVKWWKNTFLVPYIWKDREGMHGSPLQHIALKAAIVLLAVGLQKPSQKQRITKNACARGSINGIEVKSTVFYAKAAPSKSA